MDAAASDVSAAPDTDLGACSSPTECVVAPRSCCGQCGVATESDLVGLAVAQAGAYRAAVCAGMACPACAGRPDPYLVATCAMGACAARDLHTDPLTACAADGDCVLAPATCCGCGVIGAGQAIAYNPAHGSLGDVICDPGMSCPPCVPTYTGIAARCTSGQCTVVASP